MQTELIGCKRYDWYSTSHITGVNFIADAKAEHHVMKLDSI